MTRTTLGAGDGFGSYTTIYRACLGRRGALRPIDFGGASNVGSGGGASEADLFSAAGNWLAWTDVSSSNGNGSDPPALNIVNLAARRLRPNSDISVGTGTASGFGEVASLAVGRSGLLAWVLDPQIGYMAPAGTWAQLNTTVPGGRTTTLDQAPRAVELGSLTISPDGSTVSWTHDGAPHTKRE